MEKNPHAFKYDMFSGSGSFVEIVEAICQSGLYHSLYVAAHGDERSIGQHMVSVSRAQIRHVIAEHNGNRSLKGLYFGTCKTGNEKLAFHIFRETNLVWIAGYTTEVDWIDSTAVDLMFWSRYLEFRRDYSGYRTVLAEREIVVSAAESLGRIVPAAYSKMGFRVFINDGLNFEEYNYSDKD